MPPPSMPPEEPPHNEMVFQGLERYLYVAFAVVCNKMRRWKHSVLAGIALLWEMVRSIKVFDIYLQGALLVITLLETNVFLLMRRNAGSTQLPTHAEDWTHMCIGVAEVVFGAFIGWYHRGRRPFALACWLAVTAGAGLLVLAFPFRVPKVPAVELCNGQQVDPYENIDEARSWDEPTPRLVTYIVTALFAAFTRISIFAHGLTYLDDHKPEDGAYFYGILISIRLSLGLSGESWLQPSALGDDYWKPQLSLSMLVAMFAVLFTMFPAKQRCYEEVEVTNNTHFENSVKRMWENPPLVTSTCALAALNAALFGFVQYDRFYVQARFHIETTWTDPRTQRLSSDIFRSLVVIFFIMIYRMRFSVRRADGVKGATAARVGGVTAFFAAAMFVTIAVLSCDVDPIAGLDGGQYAAPNCSQHCQCPTERFGFTPVCSTRDQETYLTPCHAGCIYYGDLNGLLIFNGCSCGDFDTTFVRGSCKLQNCYLVFAFYQVLLVLAIAVSGAAMLMQGMVALRVTKRWDKPVAVAFSFGAVAVVTDWAGRSVYSLISFLTCTYTNPLGGACVFHETTLWVLPALSGFLALLSGVLSLYGSHYAATEMPMEMR